MDATFFDRIRGSLSEKRQNLMGWLQTTPPQKQQIRLGEATDCSVRAHLEVLDTALKETADQSIGVCTICQDYVGTDLLEMDYTTHLCIDHLSTDEMEYLQSELDLAQEVHKSLMPQKAPEVPGLDFAAYSRPAQIIGGDLFDFFTFQDGAQGFAIADVAGHGVSAGLLMASLQTALRTLVPLHHSPSEVIRRVNDLFCHNVGFTTFASVFLGSFKPATHVLSYSNAGHNPPLVIRTQAPDRPPATWLRPTGAAIGLVEEATFGEGTVTLLPGDILLLYTDGVTEATNHRSEEFGPQRLAGFLQQISHQPARDLVHSLRDELQEFTEGLPLADDTTIVVCRINGKL
jgi:sigma-B regulation protein RsbU (phosphoserine phosphatase)